LVAFAIDFRFLHEPLLRVDIGISCVRLDSFELVAVHVAVVVHANDDGRLIAAASENAEESPIDFQEHPAAFLQVHQNDFKPDFLGVTHFTLLVERSVCPTALFNIHDEPPFNKLVNSVDDFGERNDTDHSDEKLAWIL
jgi:hypothetical protein